MHEERLPIVVIKRSTRYFGFLHSLRVFIDGQLVGRVRENCAEEFSVTPGEHLITVALNGWYAAPLSLRLRTGDRAELICTSNQLPLHPWHVHALWIIFLFAGLYGLVDFIPPIRAFMDKLALEILVTMVMGLAGMMIFFWRVHKVGAWRPAIYLTSTSQRAFFEGET